MPKEKVKDIEIYYEITGEGAKIDEEYFLPKFFSDITSN